MIIIGYQGIGKSTIAGKNNCIDLESGNFWNKGKRPEDWYVYYCQIAEHLSKQGFTVFVSSHEAVRNRLRKYCEEPVYIVCPRLGLADLWKEKLKDRYESTKLEKDYKAWQNAEDRYEENIAEMYQSHLPLYSIGSLDYRLDNILESIKEKIEVQE